MLYFKHFHKINADRSPIHLEEDLEEICIKHTGNGHPVTIDHKLEFSELSLGSK